MKNFRRGAMLILLLAFTIITFSVFAQEATGATLTGSRLVSDLLTIVAQESASEQSFITQPNGTTPGFTTFCTAGSDMTGATRPMTLDEESLCTQNNIIFREFLLGYDALAIIANPELTFLECLTPANLNTLFATSAVDTVVTWSQSNIANSDETPITVYLPTDDTSLYVLLDNQVTGLGLRGDAIQENDSAVVIDAVKATTGAIAIIPASAVPADGSVKVLSVQNVTFEGCFAPNAESIEQGRYIFASPLYLYATTQNVNKISEVLTFAFGEDGANTIQSAGYVPPTLTATARNRAILMDDTLIGRQFTKEVAAFRIPDNIFGTVTIGGSTLLKQYFDTMTSTFARSFPAVTATVTLQGQVAGIRNYCADQFDMVAVATRRADEPIFNPDQETGCQNNIGASVTVELGKQAVVLLVNSNLQQSPQPSADAGYNVCLTVDQVLRIWSTNPELPATNWSLVSDSLPNLDLQLIAPSPNSFSDLLMTKIGEAPLIIREDVAETNADPLYRATAVSLVEGLTTYMSWQEYQNVVDAGIDNVQLVAVDAGNGCVLPSEASIDAMDYPYTINHQLVIKQRALARSEVQGLVWHLFQDANYAQLLSAGILDRQNLAELREYLQTAFTDALVISLTPPVPEASEDASGDEPEVTPEVENTPEVEATPES